MQVLFGQRDFVMFKQSHPETKNSLYQTMKSCTTFISIPVNSQQGTEKVRTTCLGMAVACQTRLSSNKNVLVLFDQLAGNMTFPLSQLGTTRWSAGREATPFATTAKQVPAATLCPDIVIKKLISPFSPLGAMQRAVFGALHEMALSRSIPSGVIAK